MRRQPTRDASLRLGLGITAGLVFAFATAEALDFSRLARPLPMLTGIAGTLVALGYVAAELRALFAETPTSSQAVDPRSGELAADHSISGRRLLRYAAWMLGYGVSVSLVALPASSAVFIAVFLVVEARLSLWKAGGLAILALGVILGLSAIFGITWPSAVVSSFF